MSELIKGTGLRQYRTITKTCKECGKTFESPSTWRRTQWCPECAQKRRIISAAGHLVGYEKAKIDRALGKVCAICGEPGFTYHHIQPIYKGGGIGDDNLIFLCQICHAKVHDGRVKL